MKLFKRLVWCAAATFVFAGGMAPSCSMDIEEARFKPVKEFTGEYRDPGYNDFDWGKVKLPNQWQQIPGLRKYSGRGVYRMEFDSGDKQIDTGGPERAMLRFEGVFYKAVVWLNGQRLGEHEGYFEPFEFDITRHVRDGRNVIVVEVECLREKSVSHKKQMLGVFGNWDVIANWRNAGGIWGNVTIYTLDEDEETPSARVSEILVDTLEVYPQVKIRLRARFENNDDKVSTLKLLLKPDNFDGDTIGVSFPASGDSIDQTIDLPGAKVWRPWKRGTPHVYEVETRLLLDGASKYVTSFTTGFRTVRVEDDWHFFINGEPMYMKGNNYAPSHVYLSETTPGLVQKDVEMMKAANYDMIRVHAHVDHPAFYEACDEAGILVFQDAPLQWGYAHGVTESFSRQIQAMVRLLYNHPSVVLWSVHNEPLPSGIDRTRPSLYDLYWSARTGIFWGKPEWNYLVLDPALVKAVREVDSIRPVNQGSGMVDNDFHQYLGWYGGKVDDFGPWIEKMQKENPRPLRFATEFGAQAFPNLESSRRFIPGGKIDRRRLKLDHMWQPGEMDNYLPKSIMNDLGQLVEQSQEYQARLNKYYIERIRLMKYNPNYGCLAFVHNDSQPAITWSVVDVWRVPKKSYFTIRDCFRDPYIMTPFRFAPYAAGEEVVFPVYIVNDTLNHWQGLAEVHLPDGTVKEWEVDIKPDQKPAKIGEVKLTMNGPAKLVLKLSGDGFEDVVNEYELK